MKKWEYKTAYGERDLTEAGKNGWEAYASEPKHNGTRDVWYRLKRPLPERRVDTGPK